MNSVTCTDAAITPRDAREAAPRHVAAGELEQLCSLEFHFKEVNHRFTRLGLDPAG